MSLSDLFCVERHKTHFLNLVKNKLDIVFANEQEIVSLASAKNFDETIEFAKSLEKLIVITREKKDQWQLMEKTYLSVKQKNLLIKDLTGAGDLFAGGFLHGFINGMTINKCLEVGTDMSSKIIQKIGARL